jgi:hypothetical protein
VEVREFENHIELKTAVSEQIASHVDTSLLAGKGKRVRTL